MQLTLFSLLDRNRIKLFTVFTFLESDRMKLNYLIVKNNSR